MSSAFALLSDSYMVVLGGQLKRREKVSGRLADILSELYMASCVLKHFRDQGSHPQDLPLLQWCCDNALHRIQDRITELADQYPLRVPGWLLKKLIFPYGNAYRTASDTLGSEVAAMLLEPCPSRFRLTQDIYIPQTASEALGKIESALSRVIAAEPVEATIRHALKQGVLEAQPAASLLERAVEYRIVTPEQADMVRAAQRARRDVIMVDEFSTDLGQHFDPLRQHNNNTVSDAPQPDHK